MITLRSFVLLQELKHIKLSELTATATTDQQTAHMIYRASFVCFSMTGFWMDILGHLMDD